MAHDKIDDVFYDDFRYLRLTIPVDWNETLLLRSSKIADVNDVICHVT
jgi:hypothetical protein